MLTANDWANITVVVTLISALTKPILEQSVPGFKVDSALHDNLLRILNLALCLVGVLWVAASHNALSVVSTPALLYYTAQQFISSQGLYFISTRAGKSIGDSSAASNLQAQLQQALTAIGALSGLSRTPTLRATGTVITPTPPSVSMNTGPSADVHIQTPTPTPTPTNDTPPDASASPVTPA